MHLIDRIIQFARIPNDIRNLSLAVRSLQQAVGRIESRQCSAQDCDDIHQSEFKVYSQWGEDGIIQFLVRNINIERRIFVEFGVQDYTEANTRFLLQNDNWSGLVIDSSPDAIESIRKDPIYWRHNLKAECAFVDKDNIDNILEKNGMVGDIGLMSIDIDGNDYWVWEAIHRVSPRIVICEYNSLFGPKRKVTIPYERSFVNSEAHFSCRYFGASIAALAHLGKVKGYVLVGSNTAGNNLFLIRDDVMGNLPTCTPEQAYVRAQYRDSRDVRGHLSFLDFDRSFDLISEMPLYDLDTGHVIRVRDLRPDATWSVG